MVFPFNFNLAVPGIANPFTAGNDIDSALPSSESVKGRGRTLGPVAREGRAPSPSLLPPLAKKRGWVPSSTDISHATASPTSTDGYLDTPAKYRDIMDNTTAEDEIDEMVADLPGSKRRRTLAGSIVSTALSAALIGTAVGLTVYRLWRDRSKHPEALPPPPYEQGGWVHPDDANGVPVTRVTPPTPRSRKSRHVAGRRTNRHRKAASRAVVSPSTSQSMVSQPSFSIPGPSGVALSPIAFADNTDGFVNPEPEPEPEPDVEDQMSWMGDRLADLIAEGQRALGKEVVVMTEDQGDPVDDGSDGWTEDEENGLSGSSHRQYASVSRPPSYQGTSRPILSPRVATLTPRSASPRTSTFDHASLRPSSSHPSSTSSISVPRRLVRESSVESEGYRSVTSSFREDESAWETPEMREMMERARRLRYEQQNRA